MKSKQEIVDGLRGFTSSTPLHSVDQHPGMAMTPGVKWLVESADCLWLVDRISVAQHLKSIKKRLTGLQFWSFARDGIGGGRLNLTTRGGSKSPVIEESIKCVDFPLDNIQLIVSNKVILLPGEYLHK